MNHEHKDSLLSHLFGFKDIKNTRAGWVDIVKGIAIVLVVYRHILIGIERAALEIHPYYLAANEVVYSFRMPLFFMLSGMFFQKSISKRSPKAYLENKVRTLLYPYVLWSAIIISLQLLLNDYVNANRSIVDYTFILTAPRAIDQMWFLFALFNISILYAILYHLTRKNIWTLFFISLLMVGVKDFITVDPIMEVFNYFIYFSIGALISTYMLNTAFINKIKKLKFLLILLPPFIITQWYWLAHSDINPYLFVIVSLIGSAVVILFSILIQEKTIQSFCVLSAYILCPFIFCIQ
ncbi:MAG: acyltransferase [Cyclobacteriaceae bacterium]|nr:acyltransferase [Cyclobacteriaceae bacterium]